MSRAASFPLPARDPCPFCEYVSRGVTHDGHRVAIVSDRPATLSFVDLKPHRPGHVLVISKRHAPTLLDLDAQEMGEVMLHAQDVVRAQLAVFGAEGVNAFQNNGLAAGQSVPHYHLHLVPRRPGDDMRFRPERERAVAAEDDRRAIATRLREALTSEP